MALSSPKMAPRLPEGNHTCTPHTRADFVFRGPHILGLDGGRGQGGTLSGMRGSVLGQRGN